ncbi:unnamed protein product [Rangifer tarandus platyrhynchus]|uniref:Uncharacterized protein n=1 Tax=Rangifer tarandus platyrhynchus TaxID=3082113 RepID=A0ABN8XSE8_RANTA|nr:unnamed protein product [Rangifer tarandus platyrhynchus]
MYVYCRLRGRLAHERSLELLDVLCSLLIHKVLLANRSHWAKQKRQDHGGKDCPPPRGRLGGGTLSPKKPLRSEEVPGVRLSTLLRSGPLMEEFLTKRSRSAAILADQRHRSPSPPPFTHRDNRAVTRCAVRSPLEGQDSVGAASAFYPPRPRGPDEGASLRPWPGGGGQGRRRPSDGQSRPGPARTPPVPFGPTPVRRVRKKRDSTQVSPWTPAKHMDVKNIRLRELSRSRRERNRYPCGRQERPRGQVRDLQDNGVLCSLLLALTQSQVQCDSPFSSLRFPEAVELAPFLGGAGGTLCLQPKEWRDALWRCLCGAMGGATRLSRESRAGSKPPTTEEAVGKPGVGRFRRKKCRRASPPQKQRAGDAPGLSRGGGWGAGGKLNSGWARNGSFFAPPSPSRLRRQRCLAPIGRGPWGKSWNQLVGKVGPKVQTRRARKAGEVETKTARLPRKSVPDLGRVQLRTGKQGSPSLTPQFPEAAGAWGFRCLSDPDHPDAQEEGHNPLRAADTRLSGLFHGAGGQWARLSEMIHALKPPGTEDPPSPLFRCA